MNRDTFPSGGWQFYEPKTKWSPKDPLNYGFYDMVNLIVQHRMANGLPASPDKAAADLEAYTRARLPELRNTPTTTTTNVSPRVSGCRTCGRKTA
jgi:hypothetical protein